VNLEAAAVETPVITSYESGVVDDWERCGGLRVHPDEDSILAGLSQAVNWCEPARLDRGKALRALIERVYSWSQVGQNWAELYQSITASHNHA
jgi:glycosyltransferase involved in cell wall biosynthesis